VRIVFSVETRKKLNPIVVIHSVVDQFERDGERERVREIG